MVVDSSLVELLVCPACRSDVVYKDRRHVIVCTGCGRRYPVRDNIPVMLVEEATPPTTPDPRASAADGADPGD